MKWIRSLPYKINLTATLRSVFFTLFPINTRRYQIAHTVLRNILIHFRPLNVQYQHWIKHHDSFSQDEIHQIKQKAASLEKKPVISIVMPVYNPKMAFLEQAIQSVLDQTYTHWELCIADDASTDPDVEKTLQTYLSKDHRIKAVFRETNGHISAASNSALELVTGEFIALLDHDDKLHPLALYWAVQVINQFPDCEVIYSDEDKITRSGKRIEPYFKSDFDEELILCQNMVSHLGVYRTKTIRDIGGFRVGLEGSQDYDLMLRVLERIKTTKIHHIPHILYHWRISKQSVAERIDIKPYALGAGSQALTNHLDNQRIKGSVQPHRKYGYKIRYKIPEPKPSIEVFFINHNEQSNDFDQIRSLLSATNYKNLIVNGYTTAQKSIKHQSELNDGRLKISKKLDRDENHHHLNHWVAFCKSDIIAIISQHTINLSQNWLEELIGVLNKEDIGAVSPQLVYKNGLIFSSGIILGTEVLARHIFNRVPRSGPDLYFGWSNLDKGYSALPPGCLLVKREIYNHVGGLNQSLFNETSQIIDFCLKLKEKGLRNVIIPDVQVTVDLAYHLRSDDEDLIQNPSDREYFHTFWQKWLEHDPAFNPNLTLRKGRPAVSKNPKIKYPWRSR